MSAKYDQLKVTAFRLSPRIQPGALVQQLVAAKIPPQWVEAIRLLTQKANPGKDNPYLPGTTTLEKAIWASVPGILHIARKCWREPDRHWLFSERPLSEHDETTVKLALQGWVRDSFKKVDSTFVDDMLGAMQGQPLVWELVMFDPTGHKVADNGTVDLDETALSLTAYLGTKQLAQPGSIILGGEELCLLRSPLTMSNGLGFDLIEWPPRNYRRGYWSIVATVSLQTIPFQPFPVLHCDLGIRRWVSRQVYTKPRRASSVYLLDQMRGNLDSAPCFQLASIKWSRQQQGWAWVDNLVPILNHIEPWRSYLSPAELMQDPVAGFAQELGAAIVFATTMKPVHRVGPGLGPRDRDNWREQVTAALGTDWQPIQFPRTSEISSRVFTSSSFLVATDSESHTEIERRWAAIASATGNQLRIEVRYQDDGTRNDVVEAIEEKLGVRNIGLGAGLHYLPGLTLSTSVEPIGALAAPLDIDSGLSWPPARRRKALESRVAEVVSQVPPEDSVNIAIVEIADEEQLNDEDDPYNALRQGFAKTGRLVQFISRRDDKGRKHRAAAAVLDGLRQLGVLVDLQTDLIEGIPKGTAFAGLWHMSRYRGGRYDRRTTSLPLCVHIDPTIGIVTALAPGFPGWLSYREALLAIAQGNVDRCQDNESVQRFVRTVLDVKANDPLLLTVQAQNFRWKWPWLNNSGLTLDSLDIGGKRYEARHWPGLHVVRIRDNERQETPQCYAAGSTAAYGFHHGVFRMGDRVFASVTNKPVQQKKLSAEMSKLSPWKSRTDRPESEPRPPKPGAYGWNPGLLELTVACVQGDEDPLPWAELTHSLRMASVHYAEATSLPLPLHLAKLMSEYLIEVEEDNDD